MEKGKTIKSLRLFVILICSIPGFSPVKEEDNNAIPELDILTCLDGFSFVLGAEGDIIYVSKNVSTYMGLKPVELLGQTMADYIHPCDLSDLASLTSPLGEGEVRRGEVTVRMKCTVTERGRLINLNQASLPPAILFSHSNIHRRHTSHFASLDRPAVLPNKIRDCPGLFSQGRQALSVPCLRRRSSLAFSPLATLLT